MGETFIAIRPFITRRSFRMDREDIQSILTVSARYVNTNTDYIDWTNTLAVYGLIDREKQRDLHRKLTAFTGPHATKLLMFLREILGDVTFDDLVTTIYKQGLSDFAEELVQERYRNTLTRMGRAHVPHAHFIQKYYCKMKKNVDNGVFKNWREYLGNLRVKLKLKVQQNNDADTKQFNAEKLVAIYILLLPQYSGYNERKAILEDMRTFFHRPEPPSADNAMYLAQRVDSNSADIVYASKMAVTTALCGDFNAARRFALKAECLGSLYESSLASTLAYHDHQYIFLQEYMKTRDRKCLGQVLAIGDRGLRALTDEHDDIRNQWNRLFMLYKALSLLDITSDFKMSKAFPSPGKVEQAKMVLKEIRGSFTGIESRREMIYALCMARAHEIPDIEQAITYMNDAIRLSETCPTFLPTEKPNIYRYLRSLKRQRLRNGLINWLSSLPQHLYALHIAVVVLAMLYWVIFHGKV